MKIPIQNVYYLLCYAWNRMKEGSLINVSGMDWKELYDLFAHILSEGITRLIRRGIDRSYKTRTENISGVRGKLDISITLKQILHIKAQTCCIFDELEHDVLQNRILKATLHNLLKARHLDSDIRSEVELVYKKLKDITSIQLNARHFRKVQIHRNNCFYRFLMNICRIIYDHTFVEEESGRIQFKDFRENEALMWAVFEDFIFNFYRLEQDKYQVSRSHIRWNCAEASADDLLRLPVMRTDVMLHNNERSIVIDAKFYSEALRGRFERKKVDSTHLYQILTYLHNLDKASSGETQWEGMLLYPVVEVPFSFDYRLLGSRVAIRSIDLNQTWQNIHEDMLSLINN